MTTDTANSKSAIAAIAEEANIVDKPTRVMAVDDEEFNLEILVKHLKKAGFEVIEARNGEEAWEYLEKNPDSVDVILMDKMMPGLSGVELTKRIKSTPELKDIVIIIQTASVGTQAVVEGIEAGAYYYLTKPYAAEVLISIVSAAAREYRHQHKIINQAQDKKQVLNALKRAEFEFKTVEEARALTVHIANFCPDPAKIALGLSGLLINAVEHGNLGIGYQRKMKLLNENKWEEELTKRMEQPEYKDRVVSLKLTQEYDRLFVHIKDQGRGFDPKSYMDFDPSRITDPNGRGIAMANIMENSTIEYLDNGSEVLVTLQL